MDREKVIDDLQYAVNDDWMWQHADFYARTMEKAIQLLKEQEPQLVLNIGEQISCKSGSCPNCGKMLNTTSNKKFCGDCGQEVKWE